MKNLGTIKLESNKLLLRRFELSDSKSMYYNWANDSQVTKYLTWSTHSNEDISLNIISEWINSYNNDDFYNWAIVIKDSNEVIGNISVVRFTDNLPEIGYVIGRKWWNNGYTSEALSLVINFLFNEVKVTKIIARHDVNNINSGKVMKKCNMKYVKTLINAETNNSGVCDVSYYEISR